jgi:acetyl-CoA synthetase
VYRDWDEASRGPAPAWVPPADQRARCNLGRLMDRLGFPTEEAFRAWSVRDRAGFWDAMVRTLGIRFDRAPESGADLADAPERPVWLPGALLNIVESCFAAAPDAIAVREHGEAGGPRERTYAELERLSRRVAAGLRAGGLAPGEAVGLLMPLTIEAVAALLGIVRAGGVAVGVAESFAPPEIAMRLRLAGARLVITQESLRRRGNVLPLYPKRDAVPEIPAVVVPAGGPRVALRAGDRLWDDFLGPDDHGGPASLPPSAHAIVLFSSGTTGEPKAIPWPQTTLIKAAADGFLYHDIGPGDVVAWPSSPGWMMGPWLVFATLINRGTIALYDGHPATEGFCRFVAEAGVTRLGLVPSLVAAWRAGGWPEACDWTRLKGFGSTGECSNPGDMLYLMARAGYRPVVEYCGGTEIGGAYLTSTPLRPNAPACFNAVAYGLDLEIRDADGRPADRGEGFLVGPSMGLSSELLNRDHHATYFAGAPATAGGVPLRRHGDQVERLAGGFFRVLGRVDDTMNLGGIKVSAVEVERVLNGHPGVRECAAVAARPAGGGPDQLVAHVVAEPPVPEPGALRAALQARINAQLNPLFRLAEVVLVAELPRTASNKLMRRSLRDGTRES